MTSTNTTRCPRCGRAIWSQRSLRAGYGPTCRAKIKQAAKAEIAAQYRPDQVAKAQELIEMRGIVAIRGRRVFKVAGSEGDIYKVHRAGCTCKARLKGYLCYHRVAAHLLSLAA